MPAVPGPHLLVSVESYYPSQTRTYGWVYYWALFYHPRLRLLNLEQGAWAWLAPWLSVSVDVDSELRILALVLSESGVYASMRVRRPGARLELSSTASFGSALNDLSFISLEFRSRWGLIWCPGCFSVTASRCASLSMAMATATATGESCLLHWNPRSLIKFYRYARLLQCCVQIHVIIFTIMLQIIIMIIIILIS